MGRPPREAGLRADPAPPRGRFAVLAERDRPPAQPFGRAALSFGRAAPLGARVAMIPTVPSNPHCTKQAAAGVSPKGVCPAAPQRPPRRPGTRPLAGSALPWPKAAPATWSFAAGGQGEGVNALEDLLIYD